MTRLPTATLATPFTYAVITPQHYRQTAATWDIHYGLQPTPYGQCLLGATDQGICWSAFLTGTAAEALADLRAAFPAAHFQEDVPLTHRYAARIFAPETVPTAPPVHLLLRGTLFQVQVWEALLRIPSGKIVSYQALARAIGAPAAVRAVGTACGRNPLGFLVPCHRVLQKSGGLGGYRWGLPRKQAILAREAAQLAA